MITENTAGERNIVGGNGGEVLDPHSDYAGMLTSCQLLNFNRRFERF